MARLTVRVQPNGRRTAWVGWHGELPKIAVSAPPVDGTANDELIRMLAKSLGVPARSVRLVGGAAARTKRLEIAGLDDDELAAKVFTLNPRPAR